MDYNTVYCSSCGSAMNATEPFCPACGARNTQGQSAPTQGAAYSYTAPNTYAYTNPSAPSTGNGGLPLGIISMISGIFSILFILITFSSATKARFASDLEDISVLIVFTFLFGIVGIILGAVGKSISGRSGHRNGMAVAGLVCSIITLSILTLLFFIGLMAGSRAFR